MPKNIVICSDGTGNTAVKGRGTNVFKLFEAVDLNSHRTHPKNSPQIAIYDDGVGTERFKLLKLLGGVAGWGLSTNVKQLYKELARIYDPGDQIFLFGFSRGAFTVRTLAGMIVRCGILDGLRLPTAEALQQAVLDTYRAYRVLGGYESYLTRVLGRRDPGRTLETLHRDHVFHPQGKIAFIGVWDTVDAVGMPVVGDWFNRWIYQFKFTSLTLSEDVEHACHALAVDDERVSFTPVLWKLKSPKDAERIEQVWFAGAHSNVGGGYPKQGLSLVALSWMLRRARRFGLRVQSLDVELFEGHSTVNDQLYDPRAGIGVFYRWAPRDIDRLCAKSGTPKIHLSVLERLAHGTDDYSPGNLPFNAEVVVTPADDPWADAAAEIRAQAVQDVLHRVQRQPRLLDQAKPAIAVGDASYWAFLLAWLVLLGGTVGAMVENGGAVPSVGSVVESAGRVALALVTLQYSALAAAFCALLDSWWRWVLVVSIGLFALAWTLSNTADFRMSALFSGFWHRHQEELRTALKDARGWAQTMVGDDR
jgi:uncharacterized protein (DUF2235 family)